MRKNWWLSYIAVPVFVAMLIPACESNPSDEGDSATANAKTAEAYTEMENVFSAPGSIEDKNFSKAEKLYMDAVAADPNNPTANFGAAFTRILGVFADTAIKNAITRWEDFVNDGNSSMLHFGIPTGTRDMTVPTKMLGQNLVKIIRTAMTDPPTITEMQNILKNNLLPRIDYAIARLAIVESNPTFEMRISGKMQGQASEPDVYLDLTEVYVMDAALHGMKASVEQFLVFKFELDGYTAKSVVQALQQNNTTFFVLAPDGNTRAQNVKTSLVSVAGKIRSGINFLKSETDDQDNDIIKKGTSDIQEKDLDTVLVYLAKVEAALNSSYTIDIKDADSDNNDYTVTVSLNTFFNSLPQNPKQAWFPVYTVDTTARGDILWRWQAQDYASFTFPDPTFSGLFPGMTNETLKRIMYIDEAFAWNVDVSLNDNDGQLTSSSTVKLIINGATYNPRQDSYGYYSPYWREFNFLVKNNGDKPVQIVAVIDGQDVPLTFDGQTPTVRLKHSDYISADVTKAAQNISAQYLTNPNRVEINLQRYAYYIIERSVNSSGFGPIDSVYSSLYWDSNIVAGQMHTYRAQRKSQNFSWYGYSAQRPDNYTNEVSVSVP